MMDIKFDVKQFCGDCGKLFGDKKGLNKHQKDGGKPWLLGKQILSSPEIPAKQSNGPLQ